ncbi:hypothetical protein H4R18_002906, partial [Coemansia javaensis]
MDAEAAAAAAAGSPEPSTPSSLLEPTPETEYEGRIANLESGPGQSTTEHFSWRQLADLWAKQGELAARFGAASAVCMGDHVALGTERGAVAVVDYLGRTKAALAPPAAHAGAVTALAFSADQRALAVGHAGGFVAVWDWAAGAAAAVTRPGAGGHAAPVTSVAFVGASRHRYVSASAGGAVLSHHIVRRLLTTVATARLDADGILFEAAGAQPGAGDGLGLVAAVTATALSVWSTRPGVAQQYRAAHHGRQQSHAGQRQRAFGRRPYAGSVAWQPAGGGGGGGLPALAYSWGPNVVVVRLHQDGDGAGAGGGARIRFERDAPWVASEDVVLCRWIERGVVLYMTRSQQLFAYEPALRQETLVSAAPPGPIGGRPWVTLATGAEAEPSYAQAVCVHRRRAFALCGAGAGAGAAYVGRLLTWAERLAILEEQGRRIDAIALATGLCQARTGQVVAGLPGPGAGAAGHARRQALVAPRLEELMRRQLAEPPASDAEARALALACVQACLALGRPQLLFGDVFERFAAEPARLRAFLAAVEPFILSGEIARLPPQALNAMVDSYGAAPALVPRLGDVLTNLRLRPGEFDVDRVLAICRRHCLWRTFARVWLGMGDPVAPIAAMVSAAATATTEDAAPSDEAPGVVVFEYLDMVVRGRSYPDDQPVQPQSRAEKYSTLVTEL